MDLSTGDIKVCQTTWLQKIFTHKKIKLPLMLWEVRTTKKELRYRVVRSTQKIKQSNMAVSPEWQML